MPFFLHQWLYKDPAIRAMVTQPQDREEIVRLVVHGTLHVLGWDHPEDGDRMRSPMWRRQERYVGRLG